MKITKELYNKIIDLYPVWKHLNEEIKKIYSRGVNLHEAFTEIICAYHLNLDLSLGKGSEDATDLGGNKIQIKGASDCSNDLSSFGPKSKFNILYFCCIPENNKFLMRIYKIPIYSLHTIKVNKSETFIEQQKAGRRPRFSIHKKFVKQYNIKPTLEICLDKKL